MGGIISWFYEGFYGFNQWINEIWTTLVIQEREHPVILAIASIIVICMLISLICSICSCCWDLCCYRARYPRYQYQPIYANEKHNYAAIPIANHPPYNPTAPSTSTAYIEPVK